MDNKSISTALVWHQFLPLTLEAAELSLKGSAEFAATDLKWFGLQRNHRSVVQSTERDS